MPRTVRLVHEFQVESVVDAGEPSASDPVAAARYSGFLHAERHDVREDGVVVGCFRFIFGAVEEFGCESPFVIVRRGLCDRCDGFGSDGSA